MKQGFVRWVKNVAVLGSAALCLWCAAGEFQSWARREGDDALLFAAGMKAQAASSQEASPAPTATPAPDYFLPDDGVVSLAAAARAPGLCHPGPQPQLRPGGGNPAFRRRAGGQFLCEGQHRLRHGFKRRPPGGALGPPETGWQRGNPHLPHPHQRGLLPKLHGLLLHGYGDPHH